MALIWVVAASGAFVASHLLMSHAWRRGLVARLGEKRFMLLYSLVAAVLLAAMILARRQLGEEAPLYDSGKAGWIAASVMTWLAAMLFVGSLRSNPALPGADVFSAHEPAHVFRITRHPMMFSFALWALAHALVVPTPGGLVIDAAVLVLALVGAAGQDRKKEARLGPAWREWQDRTSFWPFARGLAWPGWYAFVAGSLLWMVATYEHGALGHRPAGLWALDAPPAAPAASGVR